MKIALIGYGKMGKTIESIALKQGHQIVQKIDVHNREDLLNGNLNGADVAIEFTRPESAFENIRASLLAGVPVVSGTTGWLEKQEEIRWKEDEAEARAEATAKKRGLERRVGHHDVVLRRHGTGRERARGVLDELGVGVRAVDDHRDRIAVEVTAGPDEREACRVGVDVDPNGAVRRLVVP